MSVKGVFLFDGIEDFGSIDCSAALLDDSVADLANENHKPGWSVVTWGVVPDKKDGVHDWNKEVDDLSELFGAVGQVEEQVLKSQEVLQVFVGLFLGNLNFLLEFAERSGVSAFVLFEELKNFLNALGAQLNPDAVKIL